MITDSSMDYGTNELLIHFEGAKPTIEELSSFMRQNYGGSPYIITNIFPPSGHNGLTNPGSIIIAMGSSVAVEENLCMTHHRPMSTCQQCRALASGMYW